MRLIDADALSEYIQEELKQDRPVYFKIKNIQRFIEDMPTAYDVEKVVEELEDILNKSEKYLNDYSQGQVLAYLYAINIVKAGGVK